MLIQTLSPELHPGTFVYATLGDTQQVERSELLALVREPEGITLNVNSDLQAVGLTAAFSTVPSQAGISCNVVAGTNHDHVFVPVAQADAALDALLAFQAGKARRTSP